MGGGRKRCGKEEMEKEERGRNRREDELHSNSHNETVMEPGQLSSALEVMI